VKVSERLLASTAQRGNGFFLTLDRRPCPRYTGECSIGSPCRGTSGGLSRPLELSRRVAA
jgi:hypothetical protein